MSQSEDDQPLLPGSEVDKGTEELLRKVIIKQEQYIALLVNECESMLPIASVHGWESHNVEEGLELRVEMRTLLKELTDATKRAKDPRSESETH